MGKQSSISWILVGVKPKDKLDIDNESLSKLLRDSFNLDSIFTLFLCGTEVDKTGNLVEMEDGYEMIKTSLKEYVEGDYCIIAKHTEADLLFMPTEIKIS